METPEVNIPDENLTTISADLKELIQFIKDEKIQEKQNSETEKKFQIETDNLLKELQEQERIEKIKNDEIFLEKEKSIIKSETEFREGLINSISLLDEKITLTNIENIDKKNEELSYLSSIESYLQKDSQPVLLTADEQSQIHISNMADIGIVALVYIGVPIFILWKTFSKLLYQLI